MGHQGRQGIALAGRASWPARASRPDVVMGIFAGLCLRLEDWPIYAR